MNIFNSVSYIRSLSVVTISYSSSGLIVMTYNNNYNPRAPIAKGWRRRSENHNRLLENGRGKGKGAFVLLMEISTDEFNTTSRYSVGQS